MIGFLLMIQVLSSDISLSANQRACQEPAADDYRPYTLCVAELDYEQADRALNRQWRVTFAHVKAHKGLRAAQRLRNEQRKWIRDSRRECEAIFPDAPSNQFARNELSCLAQLTERRTVKLEVMMGRK